MRSNLELWEIVRDNFDKYFGYNLRIGGLCILVLYLYRKSIISFYEKTMLEIEINSYKRFWHTAYFLGEMGDPKPRKEFIEKMIKKHKNIL